MSVVRISPQLERTLRQNGMQAHIAFNEGRYQLVVQSHDAPHPTMYDISQSQVNTLANGGNSSSDRRAYNLFAQLVKSDYKTPNSWVAARSAMSSVNMGQHAADGTRYGMWNRRYPGFIGWESRPMSHRTMLAGGGVYPLVNYNTYGVSPNGNRHGKTGEIGFYWKGERNVQAVQTEQERVVTERIVQSIAPRPRPRPQEPAEKYDVTSNVYFSKQKWMDVLQTHGIVVDTQRSTLTILSKGTDFDKQYDLTDEELKKLTNGSLDVSKGGVSIDDRLAILNSRIASDYQRGITLDMLKSDKVIDIPLKPEVEQRLTMEQQQRYADVRQEVREEYNNQTLSPYAEGLVDGRSIAQLNERKGWYREGANGREVTVGDIWVEAVPKNQALREELEGRMNIHQEEEPRLMTMPQVNVNQYGVAIGKLSFDGETQKPEPISLDTFGKDKDRPLGGQMDDILRSHGINNLFRTGEVELTYNGGRYFNDEKTFELPEDVADIVYSNDEKVSVKERLDALNTVIGEHIKGGGVTEEMLRSDSNVPVLGVPEEKRNFSLEVKVGSNIVSIPITKEQAEKAEQSTLDLKRDVKLEKSDDDKYKLTVKVGDQTFEKEVPRADIGKENYKQFRSEDIHDVSMSDGKKSLPYLSKEQVEEKTYTMSAIIDGEKVTKEITAKQYQDYLRMDDYHRMKMMGKLFGEVDVKTRPEMKVPFLAKAQMVFDGIRMGLEGVAMTAHAVADVKRGIDDIEHPLREHDHHHHHHDAIIIKEGTVFARDADQAAAIAANLYNIQERQAMERDGHQLGRGV